MKQICLFLVAMVIASGSVYSQQPNSWEGDTLFEEGDTMAVPLATTEPHHLVEPEMVFVQGGTFSMGSADGESDEAPVHQVTLGDFYIGKYEVTQSQWQAIMGTTVSQQRDKVGKDWDLYGVGDAYPMYYVSWDEVQEFISRLNTATGKHYRLSTEAEWEYAARGGSKSRGYTYSGSDSIDNVAWYYDGNSGITVHSVGTKSPNELGIYDMSGNVWEWCSDWYGTYPSSAQNNPTGSSAGSLRVYRGGSWGNIARNCRSARRNVGYPVYRYDNIGFRLVLVP